MAIIDKEDRREEQRRLEQERFEAMTPEEQEEYLKKQKELDETLKKLNLIKNSG